MLIDELRVIQQEHGYLPAAALRALSERARLPLYDIHGVASFYPHFRLTPPPAVDVRVCADMSCHLRGADELSRSLEAHLAARGLSGVVVRPVSCLGQCDRAPAGSINDVIVQDILLAKAADLPGGGSLKLYGDVGPMDKSDSTLTPVNAKLHVASLNLATTGILDPSLGLGGVADVDTTLANEGGFAQTNGTVKLSKALFVQGGSPSGVPLNVDYSTKYDLRKNSGVLNPSTIKIGSATAHLNGTYAAQGETTAVDLKVNGDGMPAKDLEAFLPAIGVHLPTGASLTAGTLSTNLNVKGPTNKLVTDGTIGLYSAKLSGFDLGSKMSAVSALTGLKTGKDLDIEKLTTNVHMAPNGLRAENFIAVVPSVGNMTGAGTLDAKNNLDFKMAATLTGGAIGAMGSAGAGVGS